MKELKKRDYKRLKKEISENGASYVGYYVKEMEKRLSIYDIAQVISDYGSQLDGRKENEIIQFVITKAVENMNYQDFKELAPAFFPNFLQP